MTDKEIMDRIAALKNEIIILEEQVKKNKKVSKFKRVKKESDYCTIVFSCGEAEIINDIEQNDSIDIGRFYNNNYFYTEKRAKEVADKINFLLKLERLHDIYCPDYKCVLSDYFGCEYNFCYDYDYKSYIVSCSNNIKPNLEVCFPTEEIAQKVCDILNSKI